MRLQENTHRQFFVDNLFAYTCFGPRVRFVRAREGITDLREVDRACRANRFCFAEGVAFQDAGPAVAESIQPDLGASSAADDARSTRAGNGVGR